MFFFFVFSTFLFLSALEMLPDALEPLTEAEAWLKPICEALVQANVKTLVDSAPMCHRRVLTASRSMCHQWCAPNARPYTSTSHHTPPVTPME